MDSSSYRIDFDRIEWEDIAKGVVQKLLVRESQKLRLVEFSVGFFEEDWCLKNHIGFVLSGEMNLHFSQGVVHYKQGNALWIESGEAHKHKMRLINNQTVCLLLFERIDKN